MGTCIGTPGLQSRHRLGEGGHLAYFLGRGYLHRFTAGRK